MSFASALGVKFLKFEKQFSFKNLNDAQFLVQQKTFKKNKQQLKKIESELHVLQEAFMFYLLIYSKSIKSNKFASQRYFFKWIFFKVFSIAESALFLTLNGYYFESKIVTRSSLEYFTIFDYVQKNPEMLEILMQKMKRLKKMKTINDAVDKSLKDILYKHLSRTIHPLSAQAMMPEMHSIIFNIRKNKVLFEPTYTEVETKENLAYISHSCLLVCYKVLGALFDFLELDTQENYGSSQIFEEREFKNFYLDVKKLIKKNSKKLINGNLKEFSELEQIFNRLYRPI